jgi:threonine aldolase
MSVSRRDMLQAGLAAAAMAPATALAQTAAPAFPPVDARSVWLIGDTGQSDPQQVMAALARSADGRDGIQDSYLRDGAVAELEAAFAALLGKEDCAFFATGTLANNVAVRVLCGDNRRAIVQHESHLYRDESDAAQRLAGINLVPVAAGRASPTLEDMAAAFDEAEKGPFPVKIGAISIESPVRRAGGDLVPHETMKALAALGRAHGAGLHLDAARLMLAPPSFELKPYAALFDTVYVSLYKYLGAPFGAVLAGSKAHIAEARELRHVYGGMIYHGWIPAVMALDGLRTFPTRIAQAHVAGQKLLAALAVSGRIRVRVNPAASNIHQLEMPEVLANAAFERGRIAGVRIAKWKDGTVPLYINESILRRPVADYVKLFLG